MQSAGELHKRLRPVQRRMYRMAMLRSAIAGLMLGSVIALVVAMLRLMSIDVSWLLACWLPFGMMVLAAAYSMLRKPTWIDVARQVDRIYQLQDRTLTAASFCEEKHPQPLQRLQIEDAIAHLHSIAANRVVPRIVPATLPFACLLLVVAWSLLLLPVASRSVKANPDPPPDYVLQLAEDLEQMILEPLRQSQDDQTRDLELQGQQAVEELVKDLAEMIKELKLPGVDSREALAKLSEMQAEIAAMQLQFDQSKIAAKMRELGQVLQHADATRLAGRALEDLDYLAAADRLDEFQPEKMSVREQADLGQELEELAKKMEDQQQEKLADATQELSKAMKDQTKSDESKQDDQKDSASELAKLTRQIALRQAMSRNLAKQKAKLNEAKAVARSGGKNKKRSQQPRRTWGRGAAKDSLIGEATDLDSQRKRENITGIAADGPSDREAVQSTETEQAQALDYSERYQKYQQAAESVLEQEELPLGHRQTIRRYFEAIRPTASER